MFYPSVLSNDMRHLLRLWRPLRAVLAHQDVDASVHFGKDKFRADLDVQHFKPENIKVNVAEDNTLIVEGKHEEKQEGEGYISRHFVRRFVLPNGHDLSKVESKLSSDGVLTILAPRVEVEEKGRAIPITKTGKPYGDEVGEQKLEGEKKLEGAKKLEEEKK